MTDNPLVSALIDSAHTGDTYSAWTEFTAFLNRRLRSFANTRRRAAAASSVGSTAESTCDMLLAVMQRVAAPTLDNQMATDLADALLHIYRESKEEATAQCAGLFDYLSRFRAVFATAVSVEGYTDDRNCTASHSAEMRISFSDAILPAVFNSAASTPSSAPSPTTGSSVDEKVARWLEARASFGQKVIAELLCRARRGPTDTPPAATVREWMVVATDAQEMVGPLTTWVNETSVACVKVMLVRAWLLNRPTADVGSEGTAADELNRATRVQNFRSAAEKAMQWCAHRYSCDERVVEDTLGCVMRCLLTSFPPANAHGDEEHCAHLFAQLIHDHLLGHALSGRAVHDTPILDVVVSARDINAAWRLFPMSPRTLRCVVLPICVRVLNTWWRQDESPTPCAATEDDREHEAARLYGHFALSVLMVLANTPEPPRVASLQTAYETLVRLLCEAYAQPLNMTPTLNWERTLGGF